MKRQSHPDYLRSALARAYEMRDVIEQMRSETPTTLEEKVHFSSMLETADTFIAHYRRELSLIARRGGHGHRVQGGGDRHRAGNASGSDGAGAVPVGAIYVA